MIQKTVLTFLIFFTTSFQVLGQEKLPEIDDYFFDGTHLFASLKYEAKILKIDTVGKIVGKVGKKGPGPGEFRSDKVELTVLNHQLVVLDGIGYKLSTYDKKSLGLIEEKIIKSIPLDITAYNGKIFGLIIQLFNNNQKVDDPNIGSKKYTIEQLADDDLDNYLFNFEAEKLNPFYEQKRIIYTDSVIGVTFKHLNKILLFKKNQTKELSIPELENLSIGNKIDKNRLRTPSLRKEFQYKYFPKYELINSVVSDEDKFYFQLKSSQKGRLIVSLDTKNYFFEEIGAFHHEKLIGADRDVLYFIDNKRLSSVKITKLQTCKNTHVNVYISAIDNLSITDKKRLEDLYEYSKKHYLTVNFIFKNTNWFLPIKERDQIKIIDFLNKNKMWGSFKFIKDCDNCFNSNSIKAQINSQEILPISKLSNFKELNIDCALN